MYAQIGENRPVGATTPCCYFRSDIAEIAPPANTENSWTNSITTALSNTHKAFLYGGKSNNLKGQFALRMRQHTLRALSYHIMTFFILGYYSLISTNNIVIIKDNPEYKRKNLSISETTITKVHTSARASHTCTHAHAHRIHAHMHTHIAYVHTCTRAHIHLFQYIKKEAQGQIKTQRRQEL